MRLRVIGTSKECEEFCALLSAVGNVTDVSQPYGSDPQRRNVSRYVTFYLVPGLLDDIASAMATTE
ncbi:hypothetical protein ACFY05_32420 [Microtetraspora fusca]|uniref:Uncharacterized protein n=1 Tax=Microtetraspora fusca TaxID=1997 RepID=A0ABW6VDY8_MICFU